MPILNHVGAGHCTCIEDDTATPQQASLVLEVLMSRIVTNKGRDRRITRRVRGGNARTPDTARTVKWACIAWAHLGLYFDDVWVVARGLRHLLPLKRTDRES